jgi:hypothetical protein
VGTAIVAAHGVALLIYGPALLAASEDAAQQKMAAEHGVVCDRLGKVEGGPDREPCLSLMLQLQQRHEQSFTARPSGPF